jgi:hypothetical protein
MVVLTLAGVIAHIMSRALKRDMVQYEVRYLLLGYGKTILIVNETETIGETEAKEEEDDQ